MNGLCTQAKRNCLCISHTTFYSCLLPLLKGMAECAVDSSPAKPKRKRKGTVLSIKDKADIIKQPENSSATVGDNEHDKAVYLWFKQK